MNIQNISLSDIHPYARNPRKNDEAVKNVAASIREFGFLVPLVIDRNHEIVAGHTRYKAAKSLGMKEVPLQTGSTSRASRPSVAQRCGVTPLFAP